MASLDRALLFVATSLVAATAGCGGSPLNSCQTTACGAAGGPGNGGGAVTCTATFSGDLSGTYSPCDVTITYAASANTSSVVTAGNAIPGTPYTWTGMSFVLGGFPTAGTFDQTQSTGTVSEVTQLGSQNPPTWVAAYGSGDTFGSATLTITSLGPSSALDSQGDLVYASPHGAWTGTLIDKNPQTAMPAVMATITF